MKTEELKPCPNVECVSAPLKRESDSRKFFIFCTGCSMYGPEGDTPEEAVRLWNNLPRADGWISVEDSLPSEDGDYLVKAKAYGEPFVTQMTFTAVALDPATESPFIPRGHSWTPVAVLNDYYNVTHWKPLPELP